MFYRQIPFYSSMESDCTGGMFEVITSTNYEHYLLLYLDHELTPEQERLVEAYMESNPEARETFEQLMETKLKPEDLNAGSFKHQLYQADEQLLSYFDHELTEPLRIELEKTLQQQSALQTTLMQLEKTRSVPDPEIVFPNKSSLYRTGHKAPLLFFAPKVLKWAAILILFLGTAFWLLTHKTNPQERNLAKTAPVTDQRSAPDSQQDQKWNTTSVQTTGTESFRKEQPGTPSSFKKKKRSATHLKPERLKQELPEPGLAAVPPQQAHEPKEIVNEDVLVSRNKNNPSTVSYKPENNQEANIASIAVTEPTNQPAETPTRRNKMKTMFKKARQILERTTGFQSEESEFRFAVFSINTQTH